MRHDTEVALIRRVLDHGRAHTTDMDPAVVQSPVARYVDPARLERERKILFRQFPLMVAHVSELAEPGAFVTRDVGGVSVLVTRTDVATFRCFLNVCRHRGTRLVAARCGKKKAFSCPYHAWTYANDGRLMNIRHEAGFAGVRKDARGLAEVSVREAFGFIWIQLDGELPALDEHLAGVRDDLETLHLASHVVYRPRTLRKEIGWKLSLDIFLEGYHVSYAHRRTIAPMFMDNLNLFDRYEPHMRAVLPKRSIAELADENSFLAIGAGGVEGGMGQAGLVLVTEVTRLTELVARETDGDESAARTQELGRLAADARIALAELGKLQQAAGANDETIQLQAAKIGQIAEGLRKLT